MQSERSKRTWGHSGQVGEWSGVIQIPPAQRVPPIAATLWLVDRVRPLLGDWHRPRVLETSWAEYEAQANEVAFHEPGTINTPTWDAVVANLNLQTLENGRIAAPDSLFLTMDTAVTERGGIYWSNASAELQISFAPPLLTPSEAYISYTTYIDVWLSTTYGENYVTRPNPDAAANRPRFEVLLRSFSALVGASYRVGQSQLYPGAITETGFRDLSALPPRSNTGLA